MPVNDMNKYINKLSTEDSSLKTPYEELFDKPLPKEKEAEMHYNLVNFVETLVQMDRQKQVWDKNKKDQSKEEE